MSRAKPYTVSGYQFATQGSLEVAVRVRLEVNPLNEPFYDPFLAAVVNELDERVRAARQVAVGQFQHLDADEQIARGMDDAHFTGRNVLLALFEPSGRWVPASLYPWRRRQGNHHRDLEEALRRILADYLPRPGLYERCAVAGCPVRGEALEFAHTAPTWREIADGCLSLFSPAEIEGRLGYNRFDPERCELWKLVPAYHPAIRHLIVSHSAAQWRWLCREHHRAALMGYDLERPSKPPIRFSVPRKCT